MNGLTVRWSLADAAPGVEEALATYVAARTAFQEEFTTTAAASPGSQIIGSAPILIEACTVVAVAEGADGFASLPRG